MRTVVLDFVGTLVRPDPPVPEVYAETGARFGAALSAAEVQPRFRRALAAADWAHSSDAAQRDTWRGIVATVFAEWPAAHHAIFAALWEHFADHRRWAWFPDAITAWDALTARGFRLAVGSNFDGRLQTIAAGMPRLASCPHVFSSACLGAAKPQTRFFRALEQRLGVTASELLMIGDSVPHDVAGAVHAGWQAALVDRGAPSSDVAAEPPRFADLNALVDYLC